MKLTQDRLKELLSYDPETGVFIWNIAIGKRAKKGCIAGSLNKVTGYWQIGIDRKLYLAHRLVFLYMEGYLPEYDTDHINRERTNNKWVNLREASRTCNVRNSNISKKNKIGITGVGWHKRDNKWVAQIMIFKKQIFIGYFDNILDAAKARWQAEVKYGFPNCNTTSSAYMYLKENGEF